MENWECSDPSEKLDFAEPTMKDFVRLIYSEGSCVWSTGNSFLLLQTEIKNYLQAISY